MVNGRITPSDGRFSTIFRHVPCGIPDSKWQELVWEQYIEHLIAFVREEIVNITATMIDKRRMETKAFEFISQCLRVIWIRLFDASIDLDVANYQSMFDTILKSENQLFVRARLFRHYFYLVKFLFIL